MKRESSPLAILTSGMNAIGTILVLFIMIVILTDVIGRGLFRAPLSGTVEIVSMSIAAIVFLQFPSTLRAGRVIATDGFIDWLHERSVRAEQFCLAAYHLLGGIMFSVVCRYVVPLVIGVWNDNEFYGNIGVFTFTKWPVFSIIAFGSAVMALQYFVLAWQFVGAGIRRERLLEVDPAARVVS
jgi:TRAP-type mannitol/chloroaromatic compound transport system permease small subunit